MNPTSNDERLRGFLDLVFDTIEQTANLVEQTQQGSVDRSIRRFAGPEPARAPAEIVAGLHNAVAGGVFSAIRAVNELAQAVVIATADLSDRPSDAEAGRERVSEDTLQAALNGLIGDSLSRPGSPLDLGMGLRDHGQVLPVTPAALAEALPEPTPKVGVFVHGLGVTERLWTPDPDRCATEDAIAFGPALRRDLGFTPVYVRYNSGRRVAENGRALSSLLNELLSAYPIPVEELCLVGHSMGGLVVRSAAHHGTRYRTRWARLLRHVVCIGSPHHGSPHAKAAEVVSSALSRVDAAAAEVIVELLESRSEGIRDLEHGAIIDGEWTDGEVAGFLERAHRAAPLVDRVGYYFVAASITRDPAHPLGHLLGDLLVRVPSASGEAPEPARHIPFDGGEVLHGLHHFELVNHPEVYRVLRDQLAAAPESRGDSSTPAQAPQPNVADNNDEDGGDALPSDPSPCLQPEPSRNDWPESL